MYYYLYFIHLGPLLYVTGIQECSCHIISFQEKTRLEYCPPYIIQTLQNGQSSWSLSIFTQYSKSAVICTSSTSWILAGSCGGVNQCDFGPKSSKCSIFSFCAIWYTIPYLAIPFLPTYNPSRITGLRVLLHTQYAVQVKTDFLGLNKLCFIMLQWHLFMAFSLALL